jgi:LacI family transcriptional regulator, repressor for deo operon, udp, cdd, tsx, nupC, and nupG
MGFDDIDLASYCDPPLSTVRQPIEEIGKRAGALLIDMIEGRPAPAERITLDHQILRRASTAAPRSADVAANWT